MKPWILWSWLWSDINPSIHTATRISTLYIWVNGWVNGWVNDWVNGCVKSWVNDWVNNWVLTAETQTPLFSGQTAPVSPVPHTHTLTHTHRHSDLLPSLEWLECSASGNNTVTEVKFFKPCSEVYLWEQRFCLDDQWWFHSHHLSQPADPPQSQSDRDSGHGL